jgi:hypothetical protein
MEESEREKHENASKTTHRVRARARTRRARSRRTSLVQRIVGVEVGWGDWGLRGATRHKRMVGEKT